MKEEFETKTERESCFSAGEIEIDELYFRAKRVRGKKGRGAGGKTKVFVMKKHGNKVYNKQLLWIRTCSDHKKTYSMRFNYLLIC